MTYKWTISDNVAQMRGYEMQMDNSKVYAFYQNIVTNDLK